MEQLKVHNSLKPGAPVPFVPKEEGSVSWYACGPTVYDHSHLGHARNYVSTDIIRRILRDYFGLKVNFVMNITDVDDKIILKARRQRLLELEKSKQHSESELMQLAETAFQSYGKANLPELLKYTDASELSPEYYNQRRDAAYGKVLAGGTLNGVDKPGDAEAKMKMHLANMTSASEAIISKSVFGGADEILLPYLDSLYKESIDGHDHTIFTDVTKYWEDQFMGDMDALNVMRPDVITRVTAYVPQIVDFVDKIVQKGFAYEADGSVYFDIAAFEKAGNPYARLRPENKNNKALQEEGEGSLSKSLGGKRGPGDFALWKKSKAGEPVWPSPWGEGRPGWHIECSVMASDILGSQMDIHSGGVDLAFPHHDNELAQSEAYFCEHGHEHNWVNYFLHMGHLSISGSKMSKSLKNFQTIRDALQTDYTPRSMRIVFLMGRWNDGVEISPDMRKMARNWEVTIDNFFNAAKAHLMAQSIPHPDSFKLATEPAGSSEALLTAQTDMNIALCNSFDTPEAMRIIATLVNKTNTMIASQSANIDFQGLDSVVRWITRMVGVFGLDANASPPYSGLGWALPKSTTNLTPKEAVAPYASVYTRVQTSVKSLDVSSPALSEIFAKDVEAESSTLVTAGTVNPEALAMPYLRAISSTRDELRRLAPTSPSKKAILTLSDQIRDDDLAPLGVFLEDRDLTLGALIKFISASELMAQKEAKLAIEKAKALEKEEKKKELARLEKEREEKAKLDPREMFKGDQRWKEWNEKGIPIRTREGEEIGKSASKKLEKDWERQNKLHEAWKAKQEKA